MRRTVAVLGRLIGESPGLVTVRSQVEQLLRRQSGLRRLPPVLILGETGTGKGLLANAIHDAGPRAGGPFVAVNCAAIPETLLEAELFGFEQGAFTDARHAKAGLFQTANRGTLFLDEIGLLPQSLQAKLLTVLEDRTVRRLGSTRSEPVDVWIISATSEELKAGARRRGFREELYHRLAVVTLQLPALRDRGQDILTLAEHYLARTCTDYGLPPKTLTEDARAALLGYRWPGNVRELANLMERVALLTDGRRVTADVLELGASRGRAAARSADAEVGPTRAPAAASLEHAVGEVERGRIVEALQATGGNISQAADRLGVTRNILRYRLKKYGLQAASVTAEPTAPPESASALAAVEPRPAPRAASVQWERRYVALLRADLVRASSVGTVSGKGAVLEPLVDKVSAFGGQVEEVSPQGIVAVFGLEPVEDAPRRAAYAALAIQKMVAPDRGGSVEFPGVRIGLHAGEFLVAEVKGATRLDHEAKREAWQQLDALMGREAGTVLVSETTRPFLARRFVLTACDASRERAYRLEGLERTGLGLGDRLSPFVGRGRELEQFAHALEQARAGHGQVVAVVGEAGVGKSRLFWEFIESHRDRGSLILVTSAASYGKETPYLSVIELLKAYFQIEPRDDSPKVRQRVTEKVLSLEPALAPALSALLALLDVPIADAQWSALDPQQKRRRTLEVVKLLLLEESRRRPIIVVFEDLHWIDSETQAVLDTVVESLPSHHVLLLVSYRPEYQHAWGGKTYYAQLRLDPLSPSNAHVLLDDLLGRDEATAQLKARLVERTGGNPFFLEESVCALEEAAVLVGDRGALRLARPDRGIQVPATVQAVLAARIERLSSRDKTTLQTAAVIGKDVPFILLKAIAESAEDRLVDSLTNLQAGEFIYEARLFPDLEYTFKHALTHDVAYGSVSSERRRTLHCQISETIERVYSDRLAEHVERLAHHAFRGEVWDKAVAYGRQAGIRAAARSAHHAAVRCFEQALGALAQVPERHDTLELGIDLRCDLRNSLHSLEEQTQLLRYLHEAEVLAERLGDSQRLGRISNYLCIAFSNAGEHARGIAAGWRALELGTVSGAFDIQVVAQTYLGAAYYRAGDYRQGLNVSQQAVDLLTGERRFSRFGQVALVAVSSRGILAWNLTELGRFAEGYRVGEEAIQLAEAFEQPYDIAFALSSIGLLSRRQGALHVAIPALERCLALCQTADLVHLFPPTASLLGTAYVLAGRIADGVPLLAQTLERVAMGSGIFNLVLVLTELSEALLLVGRLDEARALADRLLEISRSHTGRGYQAHASRLLGEIGCHRDPPDVECADGHYRQALALAEEFGMRPLIAHCHLGIGKLYRRTGELERVEEHLSTAAAMYREMDMRFWAEQAEAER